MKHAVYNWQLNREMRYKYPESRPEKQVAWVFDTNKGKRISKANDKAFLCVEAQQKFFTKHLCPAAKKIGAGIISRSEDNFYTETAREMLEFIESEKTLLEGTPR